MTHGLTDIAQDILDSANITTAPEIIHGVSLKPPSPVTKFAEEDWPLVNDKTKKKLFSAKISSSVDQIKTIELSLDKPAPIVTENPWGEDDLIDIKSPDAIADEEEPGWGFNEISPAPSYENVGEKKDQNSYIMPTRGLPLSDRWSSKLAIEMVCAGDFEHAMQVFIILHVMIDFRCSISRLEL